MRLLRPPSPRRPAAVQAVRVAGAPAALLAAALALAAPRASAQPAPAPPTSAPAPAPATPANIPDPKAAQPDPYASVPAVAAGDPRAEAQLTPSLLPTPTPPPLSAEPTRPPTGFAFGSYGRMIAAGDLHGRPGRDSNLVEHGSRLDEGNYVELEMRRDDYWNATKTGTRMVATLAIASPLFHTTGDFSVQMAVRNLYLEARGFGGSNLSVWAGSRMYRGDDIYLLDYWPLDNVNTVGAGARYDFTPNTYVAAHYGLSQPSSDFFLQTVTESQPFNSPTAANVLILNRQELEGTLKLSHIIRLGETAGLKGVLWSEAHQLPSGQYQLNTPNVFETLPADVGFVIGAQVGAFTGKRDTHVNLFVRYATGLAAYGDFTTPDQLGPDKTTTGAHELTVALGGNYEAGPFGVMLGAYLRSFRNASPALDFNDVDEGIIAVRPHVFFGDLAGLAVEGSFQMQQRGVIDPATNKGLLQPTLWRFGAMPFLSPAGRGDYSRPQFRLIYVISSRNAAAESLYPANDVFSIRKVEQFLGFGVEWWFNSTSYGG